MKNINEKVDVTKISTESRNKNTENIDVASSLEIAKLINNEDKTIPLAIEKELKNIAKAIDKGYETIKNGGRIIYVGAGTSGRLGVLDASEMPPTFNVKNDLIIGIIAGGEKALRNPIEGAEDSKTQSIKDLKKIKFNKKDFLIGIAASGRTPYVISAIEHANEIGASSASISTSKDSEIGKIAKIKIEPVIGAEPITGSTRMKSGTAQKLVLNMISTGTMVKLGKVYKNWMIDVKASNEKLIERTINIVKEITGADRELIIKTLSKSDYSPKISVVMIMKEISFSEAKKLIDDNDGKLGKVI